MNNRRTLTSALRRYRLDQVAAAVTRLIAAIDGGEAVLSPFGLLVRWAQDGDPGVFTPALECAIRPPAPADEVDDKDVIDQSVSLLVADLEADPASNARVLAELDAVVAVTHPHLASRPIPPAMLHALRADAYPIWLEREDNGGTPRGDLACTPRTPPAHPKHTPQTPDAPPWVAASAAVLQPTASTPRGHREDTPGTPDAQHTTTPSTPNGAPT